MIKLHCKMWNIRTITGGASKVLWIGSRKRDGGLWAKRTQRNALKKRLGEWNLSRRTQNIPFLGGSLSKGTDSCGRWRKCERQGMGQAVLSSWQPRPGLSQEGQGASAWVIPAASQDLHGNTSTSGTWSSALVIQEAGAPHSILTIAPNTHVDFKMFVPKRICILIPFSFNFLKQFGGGSPGLDQQEGNIQRNREKHECGWVD